MTSGDIDTTFFWKAYAKSVILIHNLLGLLKIWKLTQIGPIFVIWPQTNIFNENKKSKPEIDRKSGS